MARITATRLPLVLVAAWLAAGPGLARANIGLSLRMPDGNRISTQETSERVLEAFQVGGTPAARPRWPRVSGRR